MNEPRAYYTEWSKSEREKQILYINAYIWNLERWYQWTYLQGRDGDENIENRLVHTAGEAKGGMNWESSIEAYTLSYVKLDSQWKFAVWHRRLNNGALWQPRGMGWGGRWEGLTRETGYMYTYGWFMLIYGRNQHNIVKQLSSN